MRNVFIYSTILALSLGGAWFRWTKAPDPATGEEVIIFQGAADDIDQIVWTSDEESSTLSIKQDSHGEYIWVEYTDNRPQTNTDSPEPIVKTFKAGEKAEDLIDKLSPLVGLRGFPELTSEQEESFGLVEPTTTLTVTRRGREQKLIIGGETYGTKDWYVRVSDTQKVYLLDDLKLKSLKFARNQLVDRNLWSIENEKMTGMVLTKGKQSSAFGHQNWQDPQNASWQYVEDPSAENEQLTTWINKFLKIKGNRFADSDFDSTALTAQFQIQIAAANDINENIAFFTDSNDDWWAKSEYTRGHLKVIRQSIEPLFADIDSVQNIGEESKSPSPEPQ
ncbi:MAG: DUF4340 domain-containing protein [Myxococcota bacterium]